MVHYIRQRQCKILGNVYNNFFRTNCVRTFFNNDLGLGKNLATHFDACQLSIFFLFKYGLTPLSIWPERHSPQNCVISEKTKNIKLLLECQHDKNCLQKNRLIVHLIFSVLTFAVLTCVIIMIIKVVRYRLSDL